MNRSLRQVLVAVVFSIGTSTASAASCVTGTLASYLGTSCEIEGATFANFLLGPIPFGADPIDPATISVTPLALADGAALQLAFGRTAVDAEFLDLLLSFRVTAAPGLPWLGHVAALGGTSASGSGSVTLIEDVCVDALFASPPTGCAGSLSTVIPFVTSIDASTVESAAILPALLLDVAADFGIDGGLAGTATLGSATLSFLTSRSSPVPEPGSVLLVLAALLCLAAARRSCVVAALRRQSGDGAATRARRAVRPGLLAAVAACVALLPSTSQATNHREAPLTALDQKADITDVFAFRSYDPSGFAIPRVTLMLCVDPFLEPANGPNWFPFDPDILYEIRIDNNHDAVEDIVFQLRFTTEQRLPNLFQAYVGAGGGITAPANSPPPVTPGTLIVPPRIASFGSVGLGQRQSYTVTMIKGGLVTSLTNPAGGPFFAVPANVGPRTMDYAALFNAGIYATTTPNVKVFAGTVDDPSFLDLGAAFDTLNFRSSVGGGFLSAAQDAALQNVAPDGFSGHAVNAIALEVPVSMLTRTGAIEAANSPDATIGVWGTTSRPRTTVRRAPLPAASSGTWMQVQRMGNPLVNEMLIGTGSKDRFSMDQPRNDAQFSGFLLDPALARVLNAVTAGAIAIPAPPRVDLLPLFTYAPPIAAPGTPGGPIADVLRLNTGVAPVAPGFASRLGLLGGDPAGFPNGRRLFDDVTDITLRLVAGVLNPAFNVFPNNRLGDGVNVNDAPFRTTFPYFADAPSGRDRRHIDPTEPGCTGGAGPACPF